MKDQPRFVSQQNKHSNFYEIYTTISWRNFMCLRCVHGPACQLRLLTPSALDVLIDLDQLMGKCTMYYHREYQTQRMRWHSWNTCPDIYRLAIGVLRKKRSRVMLASRKSAFGNRKLD